MRFDELVLKIPGDELRVKFHPQLTVLSGLSAPERQALSTSVLGALAGGDEWTALRYVDGTGRTVNLIGEHGMVTARHDDDGSVALTPLGSMAGTREGLRQLVLLQAGDLGGLRRAVRDDEPTELREARATLAELTEELQEALGEEQQSAGLEAELRSLDAELRTAHDTVAQREYAQVLAQLEKVRVEVAALQTGSLGVDADRRLVANAGTVLELAARWTDAAAAVEAHAVAFGALDRLDDAERAGAATIPDQAPVGLAEAVDALSRAHAERDSLDHRLQILAVAKLPAPSDLLVGELGLLDQDVVWPAARRLREAAAELDRIKVSLGGLGSDDGPEPAVIEAIESTHRATEDAESAAERIRVAGVAATGLGAAIAFMGVLGAPILMPIGLAGAAVTGTVLLLKPKERIAKAAAVEKEALAAVGAPTYLAFHIRRVDATVDPSVRDAVEGSLREHRSAHDAWAEVVGRGVDVEEALGFEPEVRAYAAALRNLGGAASEIEHLRAELADRAEPALALARRGVAELCAPFGLSEAALADEAGILDAVGRRVDIGRAARRQGDLETTEADERSAAARLDDLLTTLGFDDGELAARVGALQWAVARAGEREEARARSRPRAEIDAELVELQDLARRLRRPEWSDVSAADAAAPDIPDLVRRREKVLAKLEEVRPEVDVERLADRHAAVERRVAALELRHGGGEVAADPGAVADIQHHLLAHLTKAAQAGPHSDPVPTVLDEVLARVPADRTWDLLDLLLRLSERHQLIYLSDDPFVAAWARQHAPAGALTLLEPAPETV